ncbi:MAG: YdbH domain-containing protein, partial [Pseudomonadota bacterium]
EEDGGLGLGHVSAEGLSIESGPHQPFAADRVAVQWDWAGAFNPAVREIVIDRPRVEAEFDGEAITLHGLEALVPEGDGDAPLPAITITDGGLTLTTPAGALAARYAANLQGASDGIVRASVSPVVLERDDDRLVLETAALDLTLRAGAPMGEARIELAEARLGSFMATDVSGGVTIDDAPGASGLSRAEAEGQALLGSVRVGRVDAHWGGAQTLRVDTTAALSPPETLSMAGMLAALEDMTVAITAEQGQWQDVTAETIAFDTALTLDSGTLSGPVSLTTGPVSAQGARVNTLSLTGDAAIAQPASVTMDGMLVLDGAALAPETRSALLDQIPMGAGFDAHAASLRSGLGALLEDFQIGLKGEVSSRSDALGRPGGLAVRLGEETRLVAANGASVSVAPFTAAPWLVWQAGSLDVLGRISLAGEALPTLDLALERAAFAPGLATLRASDVSITDWRAGQRTLGAELDHVHYQAREQADGEDPVGDPRIDADGTLRVGGTFGALQFAPTSLFGSVNAVRSGGTWRIQTADQTCLGLSSNGAAVQSLSIGAFSTSLCPPEGRIAPRSDGAFGGQLAFRALSLPYTTQSGGGVVAFDGGQLDWQAANGLALDIAADTVTQSFATAQSALRLEGAAPTIAFKIDSGPVDVTARLGETRISGTLLPADLTMERLDLALARQTGRLQGGGTLHQLRVTAPGDDPVFEPLVTTQAVRIDGASLTLTGPVRSAEQGITVAESTLSLGLPGLSGSGTMTTPTLVFRPNGLQPADLSERLRGLFTDASGSAQARAEITVNQGRPTVAAEITLTDLDFQTVALGRVTGVNGTVDFDDFLGLTTPPGQQIQVAEIDPGLALTDGEVAFQMLGPRTLRIEAARWPFAGGSVSVAPGSWQIGGLDNRLEIEAEALDMTAIIETFKLPDMAATGRLSGRFPLVFSGSDALVQGARLVAIEPGGTLQYRGDVGAQAGQVNETAQLAFDALRDFRFTVLEMGADGNLLGDITLDIRLLGANPDVLYGTPFAFNLSVEAPLVPLVRTGASVQGTRWLTDAVMQEGKAETSDN